MEYSPRFTFYTSLFYCVGITLVILLTWHTLLDDLVSLQQEQNIQRHLLISGKMLDIRQYEKRQEKMVKSQTRLRFITTLHRQNHEAGLILKELDKAMPPSIQLSQVKWQDRIIRVDGYAHSDTELTAWINFIEKSAVLTHPVITSMSDKNSLKYFQLRMEVNG